VSKEAENISELVISIPSGAIKSAGRNTSRRCGYIFQFLLVRLKDNYQGALCDIQKISIPSGAIKRFCIPECPCSCCFISIPSGAIKRDKRRRNLRIQRKFQFLLVRLKVVISRSNNQTEI